MYNPADQITTLPRKTGISTYTNETRQYNSLLQMTRLTFGSLDMEYIYSPTQNNGRITQSIEHVSNQTINYTYDSLNRLSTAQAGASSFAGAWSEGYAYDGFGNLTDKNVTGGTAPSLHVTVDSATNHLTGYTYDLNGNLTNIPSQVGLAYDAENLVKTTTPAGGGAEQYANGPPISASGN